LRNKINIGLLIILIFGAALRFYNLGWGSPFYFHPDERNIAGSISRMYWEKTLNPQFFAYGSFWSYIILFLLKITAPLSDFFTTRGLGEVWPHDPFIRAILLLRFFSALQGIGLIFLSYFISKLLIKNYSAYSKFQILNSRFYPLLLPFLVATSPGLIQASHFGTFEASLAFLYTLIFYLTLKFLKNKNFIIWLLICVVFGISISIRVTSVVLLPILLLLLFRQFSVRRAGRLPAELEGASLQKKIITSLISLITLISLPAIIFFLSNPYSFSFPKQWSNLPAMLRNAMQAGEAMKQLFLSPFSRDFLSTMKYESGVALGTMQVFYAQQFNQTTPLVYQFFKVLPFAMNPIIWILFPISLIGLISHLSLSFIKKQFTNPPCREAGSAIQQFCLLLFFLLTFLPNSLIFVKWTRYVIPSLPFIYIFIFLFLIKTLKLPLISLIALLSLIFSIVFTSVYSFDTRIIAASWAHKNLKPDVKILSEVYDMGIVPFNEVFPYQNITLFNFYEMDDVFNDAGNLAELKNIVNQFDVIVLPSRRVADTRLRLPELYPNGNWFYKNLCAGNLGFHLVKTFSHPYNNILPPLSPDESFTVFDHPSVAIFVKQ
jgi:hypothetical protein